MLYMIENIVLSTWSIARNTTWDKVLIQLALRNPSETSLAVLLSLDIFKKQTLKKILKFFQNIMIDNEKFANNSSAHK